MAFLALLASKDAGYCINLSIKNRVGFEAAQLAVSADFIVLKNAAGISGYWKNLKSTW
jgi:hypothetical protein